MTTTQHVTSTIQLVFLIFVPHKFVVKKLVYNLFETVVNYKIK